MAAGLNFVLGFDAGFGVTAGIAGAWKANREVSAGGSNTLTGGVGYRSVTEVKCCHITHLGATPTLCCTQRFKNCEPYFSNCSSA